MNLDRFAEGLPDIQELPVITYCMYCGDPMIYNRELCDFCEFGTKQFEEEEDEY